MKDFGFSEVKNPILEAVRQEIRRKVREQMSAFLEAERKKAEMAKTQGKKKDTVDLEKIKIIQKPEREVDPNE